MSRNRINQGRQAEEGRVEIDLDGLALDLTPEEVIADLNFGVGPIVETDRLMQVDRPEVGRVV